MTPGQELALIATLSALLALASAAAGGLWWRLRSSPTIRAALLVRELEGRLRDLDALIQRLESSSTRSKPRGPAAGAHPSGPGPFRRDDAGQASALAGPTLIAVPDLAAAPAENAAVGEDLARRFGPIWDLADSGASADAIARATGQPIGQVELVLGLRRQLAQAPPGGRP